MTTRRRQIELIAVVVALCSILLPSVVAAQESDPPAEDVTATEEPVTPAQEPPGGDLLDPDPEPAPTPAPGDDAPPSDDPPADDPPGDDGDAPAPGDDDGGDGADSDPGGDDAPDLDSERAPEGAEDPGPGDADDPAAPAGEQPAPKAPPRTVPPEAQQIINAVARTPANNSEALDAAIDELVALGLSRDEAYRVGFGRFPIAGVARYSHDWLFPRYGPGFRFHLGTDVFAAYGTPLRATVDGVLTSGVGSLGGLWVKLTMPDGTYFYYAHLSALPAGFVEGMTVQTGDIVGYVGDSGNAKGGTPHLHIGIYPQGGPAVDPKPVLDQMLADAMAVLPEVIEAVRANRDASQVAANRSSPIPPRAPRALLATDLVRPVADAAVRTDGDVVRLYTSSTDASAGGVAVATEAAEAILDDIDWAARADAARTSGAVEQADQSRDDD